MNTDKKIKGEGCYIILLFFISLVMNHSAKFTIFASMGLALMLGISYIDYRKVQEKMLYMIIVFLLGSQLLQIGGINGSWGVIVITLAVLCACFCSNAEENVEGTVGRAVVAGILVGSHIAAVIIWIIKRLNLIVAFRTGEGKVNYIHETIHRIYSNSYLIGKGVEEAELIRILPRYTSTSVLVTYIASYGWIVGLLIVAAVAGILGKVFYDLQKVKGDGKRIGIASIVILMLEMFVTVFQNLLFLPFTLTDTFLPFFSQGIGGILLSYIVMGIVLSIYRYGMEENREQLCKF